ncbi:Major Facilitator Superfamily protein [Ascosphaera apis ARSEF 7405]|uniref:Major Facilitator Superfamily protein n=1 Tax=Ascosphaera apis ARSEF 7405 TaxID=392613 RepID=A0A168C798_9EURO|nr:Major Facilitator Superfamily protein [Ascosphaera apis ARSEF 7405]
MDASERTPLLASDGDTDNGQNKLYGGAVGASTKQQVVDSHEVEEGNLHENGVDDNEVAFKDSEEAQKQLKYIIPAMSVGIFLSAIDQTIIVASYGKIGSDLDALNLTSWVATSYFLTLTSFQPLYGRLSDIFGRKQCLLFAYVIFGLGCVMCGLAKNIHQLIAARMFQGIGGGGMTTVVVIILSDIVPLRDRGVWQGVINIIYACGSSTGAPLGGLLADYIGWRWAFLGQGPLCLVAIMSVTFWLHLPARDESHWKEKLRRIDFFGALTLVLAVFCFLLGMDRGSNVSWTLPLTLASLGGAVILLIVFFLVESYVAIAPFAPGHIIFDKALFPFYATNFLSSAAWMATIFYIPLFYQASQGFSARNAGIMLLPSTMTSVWGSLGSGLMMRKTGRFYALTLKGCALSIIGQLAIFLSAGMLFDSTLGIIAGSVIGAFGSGISITTTLVGLISNTTPEDQAIVTACSYLFRTTGSVIGLSTASTLVQQSLRLNLRSALHDNADIEKIVSGVRQSLDYIKQLEPLTRDIVRRAYGNAVDLAFGGMVFIAVLGIGSAICIKEQKLTR